MIDLVLQRLETLQAELAIVDPDREVDVTHHIAAMAKALRDVLGEANKGAMKPSGRAKGQSLRALAG